MRDLQAKVETKAAKVETKAAKVETKAAKVETKTERKRKHSAVRCEVVSSRLHRKIGAGKWCGKIEKTHPG